MDNGDGGARRKHVYSIFVSNTLLQVLAMSFIKYKIYSWRWGICDQAIFRLVCFELGFGNESVGVNLISNITVLTVGWPSRPRGLNEFTKANLGGHFL